MFYFQVITTSADDPSLTGSRVIIKVLTDHHRWLTGAYDLETGHFEVTGMVATW